MLLSLTTLTNPGLRQQLASSQADTKCRGISCYGVTGLLVEPIPADSWRGQGTPWTGCQLIASLMVEAAMQGANCPSGAIWGSVFCSTTLQHAAQPRHINRFGAHVRRPIISP